MSDFTELREEVSVLLETLVSFFRFTKLKVNVAGRFMFPLTSKEVVHNLLIKFHNCSLLHSDDLQSKIFDIFTCQLFQQKV